MKYQIINGNNIDVLKTFPDNHFDSIVTDPPYGIDFLGKSWDANTGALETYQECLRVLKPGGHILAFSAARTYHHLAITLEQAGFEIRDQIMWIYSSGFPKSQDIGKSIDKKAGIKHDYVDYHNEQDDTRNVSNNANAKNRHCKKCNKQLGTSNLQCELNPCPIKNPPIQSEWAGWGTALKPAHEPIALARKPIKLSIAKNCQTHGVGALNIDATRIPYLDEKDKKSAEGFGHPNIQRSGGPTFQGTDDISNNNDKTFEPDQGRFPSNVLGEIPDYQKYFYCPKVSRRERHIGFDLTKVPVIEFNDPGKIKEHPLWDASIGTNVYRLKKKIEEELVKERICSVNAFDRKAEGPGGGKSNPGNNHPTVKPIELMKYLIKLVTPPNGKVLDPFNGSGSTGCAAVELGHEYVGIELDPAYVEIAKKRIEAWNKEDTAFKELFE